MAVVPVRRRRRGLGAFDPAAWADYEARSQHGDTSGPPGGTLTDPNGGVIHFDANGMNDYYSPPAAFAAGQPHDNIVEQNPSSTFYGWTEYDKDAYYAAQSGQGGMTDYVVQNTPPGTSPTDAVLAENLRRLLAYAAASPKIQDALRQLKTGAFRGSQQGAFDAQNAANIKANAQAILDGWLKYRQSLIAAGEPGATDLPKMPPTSYTGTLDAPLLAALQALVSALPPDALPSRQPNVPQITTTLPAPVPISTYNAPTFPSGGGSGPFTLAPPLGPTDTGGQLTQANPGQSSGQVFAPGGGDTSGGGAPAPASGGGMFSSPLMLAGLAVVAALALSRKRR